ncbi:MAG: hypothetical protein ABS68_00145 [Niastella sp. SCN 39-18]|nr:hypothetical protein [Sphingobacteriales bacterium]ODT55163.1 MAG: hypothetical protein ABS68_00145 [Niastella sp. SCN 39-18]OJW09125.1 MAG: hypothetical protein BGO53_00260 [Sphingobacteriales bacterium 39-19]
MNQEQYKAAYAILHKTGLIAQKENIVASISQGRTTSMRGLNHQESIDLIRYLKESQPSNNDRDKMIRKLYYYCHQMGWTKLNPQGRLVANGQQFDEWAVKHSYLKKKLQAYTYPELPKLVSQFEQVYKSHLKAF